nr:PEP-CTERM sorting domain-containing protein [uncultured Roseateles sp.]
MKTLRSMATLLARRPALRAIGAATLLAAAGAASAGAPASSASYQVTSFSYLVSAGSLTWNTGAAYQTLYSESSEAGGLVDNDRASSTDFALTDAALSTSRPHASSSAAAALGGTLQGTATATPFVIAAVSQPHAGVSMAQQSQEFYLSQAGSVTFSIGYALAAGAATSNTGENFAQSSIEFAFGNYANASGGMQTPSIFSFDALSGHAAQSGTLTFTVQFTSPDEVGYYNIRGNALAYASASVTAVPEPESYALMLAGLAVLGLGHRLRSIFRR